MGKSQLRLALLIISMTTVNAIIFSSLLSGAGEIFLYIITFSFILISEYLLTKQTIEISSNRLLLFNQFGAKSSSIISLIMSRFIIVGLLGVIFGLIVGSSIVYTINIPINNIVFPSLFNNSILSIFLLTLIGICVGSYIAIKQSLQKQSRASFLNKNIPTSIDHSEKFVYFPLGVDEEHSLLITHYQIPAYHTNQIETIRHVAKSIPINYKLYVKEHPTNVTRNWRSVSDYKEIMNIPNVRFLHPSASQDELFQNCSLVISAKGSSCLEATFYGKPSIVFEKVYYSILPSVHYVETLSKLPETIRSSLQETVNLQDVERFLTIFKKNSFDFDHQTLRIKEANEFFYNGHLVDVKITEPQMKSFIEENAQIFSVLVDEYIKKLKIISSK